MRYRGLIDLVSDSRILWKSFASILHPASHTKFCPTALYSKIISITAMPKNPQSIRLMGVYLYKKLYNEISHKKVRYKLGWLIISFKKIGPKDLIDDR